MQENNFRFEILDDSAAFSKIGSAWERLCDELPEEITVFASPIWYECWWTHYSAGAKLRLFTMWAGDRLVGIAPLMSKKASLHGFPVRAIGFIQNNQSLHNDFIVIPEYGTLFFIKLVKVLFETSSDWDVIHLRNIPPLSKNYHNLSEVLDAEGRTWKQVPNYINSPYLIPSGSWSDYVAGRSRKTRKNLNHIQNRICGAGEVSVRNITSLKDFLSCKEEMFEIARQSWSEKAGDSMASPANRDFFEALAARAAEKGWLSIWALYLDGKMVAVEFHLKAYGREHAMRGHYLPEFASMSPGTYLEMNILEHIFQDPEKLRVYDFCGSFDEYKKKWTSTFVPHSDMYIFKETIFSKAVYNYEFRVISSIIKTLRYAKRMLPFRS